MGEWLCQRQDLFQKLTEGCVMIREKWITNLMT